MVRRRNSKRPKGKKTKQAVRNNYAVPTRNIPNSLGGYSLSRAHHQVVGLANPWSRQAKGSKIPDDDATQSIAATYTSPKTFEILANGSAVVIVKPGMNGTFAHADVTNTTTQEVTSWISGIDFPNYAEMSSAFSEYRIVSWGVRVYSTYAPTAQNGSYKIITLPGPPGTPFSWAGSLFEATTSLPFSEKDIHWISAPIGVQHKEYIGMSSLASWDNLAVIVEGATPGWGLTLEVVFNIECQIKALSIVSGMATPAADFDTHVVRAASKTRAKHKGAHNNRSFGSIIMNSAKDALTEGLASLIPFVGPSISRVLQNKTKLLTN